MFNAVDKFVLLDDVNFIMRGFINRNSILVNGKTNLFSIPLEKPSQNKLISYILQGFSFVSDKFNKFFACKVHIKNLLCIMMFIQ